MDKSNKQVFVPEDVNKWWEAAFFDTLHEEVRQVSGADMLRAYVKSGALDRRTAIELARKHNYIKPQNAEK